MAHKTKPVTVALLALLLSSCATGNELKGTWMLTVVRHGTCRVIEHQASTDQLSTSTVWRGDGCGAEDAVEQPVVTELVLETSPDGGAAP